MSCGCQLRLCDIDCEISCPLSWFRIGHPTTFCDMTTATLALHNIIVVFVLLLLVCSIYNAEPDNFVIVETSLGRIMGRRDGNIASFLGVPYAQPPIGPLRFRPPRPPQPWYPTMYKAFDFSFECLQSGLFAQEDESRFQNEDCLYLNIWRPMDGKKRSKRNGLLPVLVWIYGGAFIHGGASKPEYYGNKLAQRDVVVVTLNYRVGALGFLVSTADGLFGNYGLDDQKMAMQWVQDNIRSFGGDPERVTLFGESAGAMSIGLHMLDQQHHLDRAAQRRGRSRKYRKKLFNAVILQSNPLGYKYRSIAVANFIGAAYRDNLDCEDLRCMQSESQEEIIHVQDSMLAMPRSIGDFFAWGPVRTDDAYYRETRLRPGPVSNITVRQPLQTMQELRRLSVPVIIGSTSDEGTVFVFTAYPFRMGKVIYQGLVYSFFRTSAPTVLRLYASYAERVGQSLFPDYRLVLSKIIGDYLFRCPNQYFAMQLAGVGTTTFLYQFALPTRTPGFPCCDGLSCHTCELPYTFNQLEIIAAEYSWQDGLYAAAPTANSVSSKGNNYTSSSSSSMDRDGRPTAAVGGREDKGSGGGGYVEQRGEGVLGTDGVQHFPDIFGAATAWMPDSDSGDSFSEQMRQRQAERMRIDTEVSRLMAGYWTTFATYGDPNGEMSRNGYAAGTRVESAVWWPHLLGDLPSLAAAREIDELSFERRDRRDNGAATRKSSSRDITRRAQKPVRNPFWESGEPVAFDPPARRPSEPAARVASGLASGRGDRNRNRNRGWSADDERMDSVWDSDGGFSVELNDEENNDINSYDYDSESANFMEDPYYEDEGDEDGDDDDDDYNAGEEDGDWGYAEFADNFRGGYTSSDIAEKEEQEDDEEDEGIKIVNDVNGDNEEEGDSEGCWDVSGTSSGGTRARKSGSGSWRDTGSFRMGASSERTGDDNLAAEGRNSDSDIGNRYEKDNGDSDHIDLDVDDGYVEPSHRIFAPRREGPRRIRSGTTTTAAELSAAALLARQLSGGSIGGRGGKKGSRKRSGKPISHIYMHELNFDEVTNVQIIENDCICNAWNKLEYRF